MLLVYCILALLYTYHLSKAISSYKRSIYTYLYEKETLLDIFNDSRIKRTVFVQIDTGTC